MDRNHAIELLQQIILENSLPRTDMALFGLLCPYCGKSDRIHGLEAPQRLNGTLAHDALLRYAEFAHLSKVAPGFLTLAPQCINGCRVAFTGGFVRVGQFRAQLRGEPQALRDVTRLQCPHLGRIFGRQGRRWRTRRGLGKRCRAE